MVTEIGQAGIVVVVMIFDPGRPPHNRGCRASRRVYGVCVLD